VKIFFDISFENSELFFLVKKKFPCKKEVSETQSGYLTRAITQSGYLKEVKI